MNILFYFISRKTEKRDTKEIGLKKIKVRRPPWTCIKTVL
jgi:hypothetical protein